MTSKGYALARAELIRALTAYTGITTSDGLADGTTLIDSNLIGKDSQKIVEKTILIMSGDADWEDKGATAFNTVIGQITLQGTGFSAQIKAGTIYRILNISSIEIDVANIDTKIGTNGDAAGTTTLFAWLARLFAHGGQGLVYYGKVTTYTDITHFKASGLAGFGDDYFNNFRVYVVRDTAGGGAAPQGEMQPISDYVSSDGTFTHTAFTAPLAVDDEILILHQRIAEIKDLIDRLGAFTGTENLKAILGNLTTTKNLGGILGALTTTNNLKGILGAYTTAAPLKATIDAIKTLVDSLDLTTFKQETVAATDVNGTTWKDLLDRSTITKPTKICGFMVTVGGTWAGKAQVRITDGAGDKIFPFQDQYEQDTEFTSGAQVVFNFSVVVPVADGYKFQFRSSNAADGAGETLALNNLDVIEAG